jgi:hypothetical protein
MRELKSSRSKKPLSTDEQTPCIFAAPSLPLLFHCFEIPNHTIEDSEDSEDSETSEASCAGDRSSLNPTSGVKTVRDAAMSRMKEKKSGVPPRVCGG